MGCFCQLYRRHAKPPGECNAATTFVSCGLATHNHESAYGRLPSGWVSNGFSGEPGWGWSAALLAFMEGSNISNQIDWRVAIEEDIHADIRTAVIPSFICPSDPYRNVFEIGEGDGSHTHSRSSGLGTVDDGDKLFDISKSNYIAMFGTFELEDSPYKGDGMYYGNSRTKFRDVTDGLSNTIMVGERSSQLGGSIWHGNIPEAAESFSRIVGVADHAPNSPVGHFEDFRSYHTGGANFMRADGSVQWLPQTIDEVVYKAMATAQRRRGPDVQRLINHFYLRSISWHCTQRIVICT